MTIEVRRMWQGGPLRQCSDQPQAGFLRYQSPAMTCFAGAYVCDDCQSAVKGVYYVRQASAWLCAPCKETVRTGKPARSHERKLDKAAAK